MYRHGDIALVPVRESGNVVKVTPRKRIVLARGEVTGHHHTLQLSEDEDGRIEVLSVEEDSTLYLRVEDGAAILTHQEHNTLRIEPGVYRLVRQREFSGETGWSRVVD